MRDTPLFFLQVSLFIVLVSRIKGFLTIFLLKSSLFLAVQYKQVWKSYLTLAWLNYFAISPSSHLSLFLSYLSSFTPSPQAPWIIPHNTEAPSSWIRSTSLPWSPIPQRLMPALPSSPSLIWEKFLPRSLQRESDFSGHISKASCKYSENRRQERSHLGPCFREKMFIW